MEVSLISKKVSNDELVNEAIRFKEVLVIGPEGEQLGIRMRREALEMAYDRSMDLLCVAPMAQPPVCKILDYGKFRFEQQKKNKEAKKNQHITEIKPMRLSPVIDNHDFETKLRQASGWLEEGTKVKIDMRFRGRLITRIEVGRKIMDDFVARLSEISIIEKRPGLEGNTMSAVIAPKKK